VDPETRDGAVIDPLLDHLGETLKALSERGATLRWIVDTHSHGDHISGAAALRAKAGGDVVMHPAAPSEVATVRPGDGDVLPFGEHGLRVHHAPGNTPDSLVLEAQGAMFTGDTMLIGTVGLRDAPGSDPLQWFATLHRIFDDKPDPTVLHPGHDDMGRTMTTMQAQRRGNRWLRLDDRDAFLAHYQRDQRPARKDAPTLLEANRVGLLSVPRDLESASGLLDPARTTEAQVRAGAKRPEPEPDVATGLSDGMRWLVFTCGVTALVGTAFGFLLHPALHGLSAAAGLVLLVASVGSGGRRARRRAGDAGLYYQGPVRKSLAG
jgi:glyoxylase-like metal-dependent hydrolase (beta-lactamase superfamily II)